MLKEYDDLDILGVTFDSEMTFENHLRSVSRAASQRLGMKRKSWRVFHDRSLLVRCVRGFVLHVLEYCFNCSVVLGSRYTPNAAGPCSQGPCSSSIRGSIMDAVQDQV